MVGDLVRISKHKTFLPQETLKTGQKKFFSLANLRIQFHDLDGEPITGSFWEKELQKTNQEKFRIVKVIKRKGYKLYAKWKGYNNSFNSWINKKDLVLK